MRPLRTVVLALLVATGIMQALPGHAAAAEAFTINTFHDDIQVQRNADIDITETIAVDFGTNERHGIFRTIPTRYATAQGLTRSIRMTGITVDRDPFTISRSLGEVTVKIGDPDQLVSGAHSYTIHYRVQNALNGFADHTELYWNVTGNDWDTAIEQATATVTLPQPTSPSNAQQTAYEGIAGSTNLSDASFDGRSFHFGATTLLNANEGLTIVAGWPTTIVQLPGTGTKIWWFLLDNWPLLIPIIILIGLIYRLMKFGKDPAGRGTIVPEFAAPKDITLLEAASLMNEKFRDQDLTAMIIGWAVAGAITINEPKRGQYELTKVKELSKGTDAELSFFHVIFGDKNVAKLSDLQHSTKLVTAKAAVQNETLQSLVTKQYVTANPQTVKAAYIAGGVIIIALAVSLAGILGAAGTIAGVASGILFVLFAPFMPKRTLKGVQKKEEVLGFQLYLKTAERYRMEFAEKEKLFEKFLPYAIALGVAGLWAKAFKDIATAPSWYTGYYVGNWSTTNFANGLSANFSSNLSAVTTASSGGSGFSGGGSGGGFGCGGGGSW